MKRRNFIKNIGLTALSMSYLSFSKVNKEYVSSNGVIKPKALKKGDLIGLITPGSYIDDDGLQTAIDNIESLGFRVKLSENIRKVRGYNAGTKQERVDDIHSMFLDSEVKGIWAARGGYGSTGILPLINFDLIKDNPKVFVGYSDITALHLAIFKETGLVTFHGPVASSKFTDYTKKYILDMITSKGIPPKIYPSANNDNLVADNKYFKPQVFNKGTAKGQLRGGNLSLITSLIGTPWELDISDKLLFIEDIEEAPYSIDRMLIQLNQNQGLNNTRGIAFGVFDDSDKPKSEKSLELDEMFVDNMKGVDVPSGYGFSFGHIDDQVTLPMGINAIMNSEDRTIQFTEGAVI